jgi:hypothetical protein
VISQRIYIGNASLRASDFGTPTAGYFNTQGNASLTDQVSRSALQTSSFGSLLTLTAGQFAYLTEAYFTSVDLQGNPDAGVYTRAIF